MRSILPLLLLLGCTTPQGDASEMAADTIRDAGADFITVELATVGVDMHTRTPVALLRDEATGEVVPILIGIAEAEAIARALHGVDMPRPMTHDLLTSVLGELGGVLDEVRVHAVRDGTYYGSLYITLRGEETAREIDSRPSDAMALALRTGAPIRVARSILQEAPEVDFRAPGEDSEVVRALGVSVIRLTPEVRAEYALPDGDGVVVTATTEPAREAGVRRGDLVLAVDGRPVARPMDFLDAARRATGLDAVELRIWRDGEERTIELSPDIRDPRHREPRRPITT